MKRFLATILYVALGQALSLGLGMTLTKLHYEDAVTSGTEKRFGLIETWREESAPIRETTPEFTLTVAGFPVLQQNQTANVRLWELVEQANGRFFENYPQEIGDCTSFAAKNAHNVRLGVQVAQGQRSEIHEAFPPFVYSVSRTLIGKGQIRGDGSLVAWVAQGMRDYGILAVDDPNVPAYSGTVARSWGKNGPPKEFKTLAASRKVKTIAPVKSGAAARDAVCNFYPVMTGSDFGTKTIRKIDNRNVAAWDDQWGHAMCIIAYDGRIPGRAYFYILNSWGPSAHPAPLNGEPPGGFWVTAETVDRICKTGDCWSISDVAGFPVSNPNLDWFTIKEPRNENLKPVVDRSRNLAL